MPKRTLPEAGTQVKKKGKMVATQRDELRAAGLDQSYILVTEPGNFAAAEGWETFRGAVAGSG